MDRPQRRRAAEVSHASWTIATTERAPSARFIDKFDRKLRRGRKRGPTLHTSPDNTAAPLVLHSSTR